MRKFAFLQHKKLLAAGLLLSPILLKAQTNIAIRYYDGTEQSYTIQTSGRLYFDNSNLMLAVDGAATATSIPLSIIRKITFPGNTTTVSQLTKEDIILFPNPAKDFFVVKAPHANKLNLRLFSIVGKEVMSGTYQSGEAIDISHLSSGLYIVNINNNVYKLVKP